MSRTNIAIPTGLSEDLNIDLAKMKKQGNALQKRDYVAELITIGRKHFKRVSTHQNTKTQ